MASIYNLNHPSQSWDPSTTGLEDHPFFAPRGHRHGHRAHHGPPPPYWGYGGPAGHHHGPPPPFWGWEGPSDDEPHGRGRHGHKGHKGRKHRRGDQPEQDEDAETPRAEQTEANASTEKVAETNEQEVSSSSESESDSDRSCRKHKHKGGKGRHGMAHGFGGKGGRGGKCKGPHGKGHKGMHMYGYGGHFGGRGHHHGPHGGPHGGPGAFGFPGPHHHAHPPHPFHAHHHTHPMSGFGGPFHGKGHHKGGRRGHGKRHGGPDEKFLRKIAEYFGIPFATPNQVDFVPSADVFDTPASYILQISLPGAKKSDLNVDYDAEESVLRITGIVHRPNMNEELHQALVMKERSREVGVFEREIRLGTKEAPAPVLIDGIVATLEDGILTVTIPKIEDPEVKQKVLIEDGEAFNEKDAMVVDRSRTMTPESESESEEEAKEYVKIPVQ
ncbi:hypothetical protein N7493_001841 [Penicillium malachiteum]|uniref:SHSP domain-containing protein n=1 Tax=Penicillium malachiteum TaxID=1324776 RepID=A0AAD6HV57_9EURO|nr:hypothetical protein N7493_001841 [Penicillium malachiteum]